MVIKLDFTFKQLRKYLSKRMFLILMLTIIAHIVLLGLNSDTVARHRAAFGYSIKYHQKLVTDIKTVIDLEKDDKVSNPNN